SSWKCRCSGEHDGIAVDRSCLKSKKDSVSPKNSFQKIKSYHYSNRCSTHIPHLDCHPSFHWILAPNQAPEFDSNVAYADKLLVAERFPASYRCHPVPAWTDEWATWIVGCIQSCVAGSHSMDRPCC